MPTPKEVKIGAITYRIYIDARKWNSSTENDNCSGYTDLHKQEIVIDPSMSKANIREVVLHECLHAMFADSGVTWPIGTRAQEETIVRVLSPRLTAFIQENAGLVEWLSQNE